MSSLYSVPSNLEKRSFPKLGNIFSLIDFFFNSVAMFLQPLQPLNNRAFNHVNPMKFKNTRKYIKHNFLTKMFYD